MKKPLKSAGQGRQLEGRGDAEFVATSRVVGATTLALVTGGLLVSAPAAMAAAKPAARSATSPSSKATAGIARSRCRSRWTSPRPRTSPVAWRAAPGTATPGLPTQAATGADFKSASRSRHVEGRHGREDRQRHHLRRRSRRKATRSVALTLSAPSAGLELGDAAGSITILNDETTPGNRVSASDVTIREGDSKPRSADFALTLSRPAPGATVSYRVLGGTATGGWKAAGRSP